MKNKKIEVITEWGKLHGRPYKAVLTWVKDRRYKLGKRRKYWQAEWIDEIPFVKFDTK